MNSEFGVVDLFSGPGGLGEGFSAFHTGNALFPFSVEISIEKEKSAHATLVLRSFLRMFPEFPSEYYSFLNGEITEEPDWQKLYPDEWQAALDAVRCMELGKPETSSFLRERIAQIHQKYGDRTILIGGPPCQAYSLAGRARNSGKESYLPHEDERNFLYQKYVEVLKLLKPAAFVMENVKGMLSSATKGDKIFQKVMRDLKCPELGGTEYTLTTLSPRNKNIAEVFDPAPQDFIVRAEEYGIPQARHRVIIIGFRSDIMARADVSAPRLESCSTKTQVRHVLRRATSLRSGLSRDDSASSWARAIEKAATVLSRKKNMSPSLEGHEDTFRDAVNCIKTHHASDGHLLSRTTEIKAPLPNDCPEYLRDWLEDSSLSRLPNHETRGHMESDLARYLFASVFGEITGRSPTEKDFPTILAPKHKNWNTGKFTDRFRVQLWDQPASTITSHISKDGHYFIHPDPTQCRSLTVREAARLQTFPDNYLFKGTRTEQYIQVGNAVPPYLAHQIAEALWAALGSWVGHEDDVAQQIAIPSAVSHG